MRPLQRARRDNEVNDIQTDFSPGKNLPACIAEASPVGGYATRIGDGWRRATQGVMDVARVCFEASERLTVSQKKELVQQLPFKEPTFSKLGRIGKDTRLHAPELERLLPPHYSIVYLLTKLADDELEAAVKEDMINPDMKRADLQKWLSSRRRAHVPEASRAAIHDEQAFAHLEIAWSGARGFRAAWVRATDPARERFLRQVLRVRPAQSARPSQVQ
jgi:hypothetical protein